MVASPTTYPGSLLPLRGLAPFTESDRDALFGRDTERDAVTKLITQEGVRAGLLFGEPGVGKTSLLRAAILPHLTDHGVVALPCDDIRQPAQAFAQAVQNATHQGQKAGEKPTDYLARVVSAAMQGQLFVFILDDIDLHLKTDHDGHVAHDLGDLFARVATRSGGRARFLFTCADSRMHALDALERRTGSLFPPPARYRLGRFTVSQAHDVLDKTLALAGVSCDPAISRLAAEDLGRAGLILPAELQVVARVIGDQRLHTPAELARAGGAGALLGLWVERAADATGDRRRGLRLLAELAADDRPLDAQTIALRAGVEPRFAAAALPAMAGQGILVNQQSFDAGGETGAPVYLLVHEVLGPRVRDLAVPASEGARRARQKLADGTARGGRMTLRELVDVRREGVVPATQDEARTLAATKRHYLMIAGAAAAVPIAFLILMAVLNSGMYHLTGRHDRIVVRSGRPGLSSFWWLGGGEVVADTGITPAMVTPDAWKKLSSGSKVGKLGAEDSGQRQFVSRALDGLRPELKALLHYAMEPDEKPIAELRKALSNPDQGARMRLLRDLMPIARGGPEESKLVLEMLNDPAPSMQRAALELAADVARRRPGAYGEALARAMASGDDSLRRMAFGAAHSLGSVEEAELLSQAMALDPPPPARADLLVVFASQKGADAATEAAAAAGLLAAKSVDAPTRASAWEMLERAFTLDPAAASKAAAKLVGDSGAEPGTRIRALKLLEDRAPKEVASDLTPHIEAAALADAPALRAAALPLYARYAPDSAVAKLKANTDTSKEVKAAVAAAWGELLATNREDAEAALKLLIEDRSPTVRAAAAKAYGRIGREAQETLVQLTKVGGGEVAEGAAWGLAASLEAGGWPGDTVVGIGQLWKNKGPQKRKAAEIYGRLARTRPNLVMAYVASAARTREDDGLRAIGVEGLCQALASGDKKATRDAAGILRDAADDEAREVRARVASCVLGHPEAEEVILKVAPKLAEDVDAAVRADAARALSKLAAGQNGKPAGPVLVKLAADDNRMVRIAAAQGLASLAGQAPDDADEALRTAWTRADAEEKLALIAAAQAVGGEALVKLATGDPSPTVRARALSAVVALGLDVPALLGGALTDADPEVRREALRLLGDDTTKIAEADAEKALELATGDRDPSVAEAALTALASREAAESGKKRLSVALADPSERVRAQAARAASGLAVRNAKEAAALLEPMLADPAHDVRLATVASLGAAYAGHKSAAELAKMLAGAEKDAVRRWAIADGLLRLARAQGGKDTVTAAVKPVADKGPPMAKLTAQIILGLVAANADGPGFVAELVP